MARRTTPGRIEVDTPEDESGGAARTEVTPETDNVPRGLGVGEETGDAPPVLPREPKVEVDDPAALATEEEIGERARRDGVASPADIARALEPVVESEEAPRDTPRATDTAGAEGVGDASTAGNGFGGFSAFGAIFAPEARTEGGSGGDKKPPRGKGEKLTPDDRAQMAILGGGFVEKGLDFVAKFIGSDVTVQSLSDHVSEPILRRAREKGIQLPDGIPLDIASGTGGPPVIQQVSMVLRYNAEAKAMVPCRFAAGITTLRDDEKPIGDPKAPKDGECVVVPVPANLAHVIAYNLADVPSETMDRLMRWVERNETFIRMTYAGVCIVGFLGFAFTHRR